MSKKFILIGVCLSLSLFMQGCYTQLAMFYPEPEIELENEDQFFETYSRAPARPGLDIYAQNEGSMPLGYATMQRRFNPFGGGFMGFKIIIIMDMVVMDMDRDMEIICWDIVII